ncbi:LpxI family protein [Terricaulis sp.]|uniref:LpxI family protein n=1 Tax=Terricaulis sp. TaxID=2768686 RepID=UPI00378462BA
MSAYAKLGLIAGGGELPVLLAEHLKAGGSPYFVARIAPYADAALDAHPGATLGLGAMGARMKAMKDAGVDAIVLIGQVPRPDLGKLELDEGAIAMLPAIMAALQEGDDTLLRAVLSEHEKAGFRVLGADAVMADLLARPGVWGAVEPTPKQFGDVKRAAKLAAAIGSYDVGQGVVVADGVVLAVEAQEGTDRMLARVAEFPETLRGSAERRRGVLVKRPKPIQDMRIDLPVVGVQTIERAASAGLAGVAVQAGSALVVRREAIIAAADKAGLFVLGFDPADVDA